METFDILKIAANALNDKKAMQLEAIRIDEISDIADYFVICTATSNAHIRALADEVEEKLKEAGVDTLILGCTHYPLLKGVIGDIMGEKTRLIDSGAAAARAVAAYLKEKDMLSSEKKGEQYKFFVSDSPESFEKLGSLFLGRDMGGAEIRRIL